MCSEKLEMELKPYEAMCEHTKTHLNALITGSDCVDPNEILAVAKTLKELSEIKERMAEICYKSKIIESMEKDDEMYGYTKRGRYTRFMPNDDVYEMAYMNDPNGFKNRMGYGHDMTSNRVESTRYGQIYNDYDRARKHYTETKDYEHKKEMENHATEYAKEVKAKMWEMYNEAEPNAKATLKEEMRQMLNGMN